MNAQSHWDSIYSNKRDEQLSWTEAEPTRSLQLIRAAAEPPASVLDIGGGRSSLADRLVDLGYRATVLDISEAALRSTTRAQRIVADITTIDVLPKCDIWHDRAVFHFLTDTVARRHYVGLCAKTVALGGSLILITFALDGPTTCSGLPVCRYDAATLAREFADDFVIKSSSSYMHQTPWNVEQHITIAVLERIGPNSTIR